MANISHYLPFAKYNSALESDHTWTFSGTVTFSGTTNLAGVSLTDLTTTGNTILGNAVTDTTVITGATSVTSSSASSLAVGLAGATNPAFVVDSSTASQAAGLSVTGATAAGTVAVAVISSGADANLTLNAKGTGTIGIGSVSTGTVTVTPALALIASLAIGTNVTFAKEVNHTVTVNASTTANTIGGSLAYAGGVGTGTAAGGAISLTGGASSNGTAVNPGAGGAASLVAGAAGTATTGTGGAGGTANVTATAGGASTGASSTAGKGGDATLTAGNGGASSGGGDTGGAGGSVVETAGSGGTGATAGKGGAFFRRAPLGAAYLRKMAAPTAKTTNATLTAAEVMGGWITVDGAGSATSTQTMPSGTDLTAAFPSNLAAGDCFDFKVINISTDAAETAIIAFGADITGVGSMIVGDNASGSEASSGTFTLRYSGANVWVMYRA